MDTSAVAVAAISYLLLFTFIEIGYSVAEPRYGILGIRNRRRQRRAEWAKVETVNLQQDVDAILEQIQHKGINSLSADQHRILKRATADRRRLEDGAG